MSFLNQQSKSPHWLDVLGLGRRVVLVGLVVAVLGGLGAWQGRRWYQQRREAHLLASGRRSLAEGNLRAAFLSGFQAHSLNPTNGATLRLLAEITEQARSPAALHWRRQQVTMEPGSVTAALDWLATALLLRDLVDAAQALKAVPAAGRDEARYHELSGALAVMTGRLAVAEQHFTELLRRSPAEPRHQLNLATVRIQSTRPTVVQSAREQLEALRTNAVLRGEALRVLLADAQRHGQLEPARRLADELFQLPGSRFLDQLDWLEFLQQAAPAALDAELARVKHRAGGTAATAARLLGWLVRHQRAAEALRWAESLPPEIRDFQPVPLALVEAHFQLAQWPAAGALIERTDWTKLEFLQQAFRARIYRERQEMRRAQSSWDWAVMECSRSPQSMAALARLTESWGWRRETELLWNRLANLPEARSEALMALSRLYRQQGDTRNLLRVARLILELDPAHPVARNNVAMLSLLLGVDTDEAHRLAAENHRLHPGNRAYLSTHAFSLHLQERNAESWQLLRKLPAPVLQQPEFALYYGLVAARQSPAEARAHLERGGQAANLLPEERRLLQQALNRLP